MKSNHKDFIEWYNRERNSVIEEQVIPHQNKIFHQFSKKFASDAEKDLSKWRIKLFEWGSICSQSCNDIHSILKTSDELHENLSHIAEIIINMDYNSVSEFFTVLKEKYKENNDILEELNNVINYLSKMRKISKEHTNIIKHI